MYNLTFVPTAPCRAGGRLRSDDFRRIPNQTASPWQNAAKSAERARSSGRNISHAHNVTPRRFEPNLQRVRALVNGGIQRLRVCTRCLRSGKVVKAA